MSTNGSGGQDPVINRTASRLSRVSVPVTASENSKKRKKKDQSERRKSRKKKSEGLFTEIGRYAATLAGAGVDDPEETYKEEEKKIMLPGEHSTDADDTGSSRLQRMLQGVVEQQLTPSTGLRFPALGMDHDLIIRVALEDEWQLVSCASLPFTIIYFLIFMLFFQNHYSTVNIYLAESTLRRDIGYPAMELAGAMDIYDWLDEYAVPYLWGPRLTEGEFNADTPSLYQEAVAGLLFTTTRATSGPCEFIVGRDMDCYTFTPDSKTGSAFGYEPERLLRGVNATTDSVGTPARASTSAEGSRSVRRAGAERSSPPRVTRRRAELSKPVPSLRGQRKGWGVFVERDPPDVGRKTSASRRTFNQRLAQHIRDRRAIVRQERLLRESRSDLRPDLPTGAGMELSSIVIPASFTYLEMRQELQRWQDIRVINMNTVTFSLEALILNEHLSSSFQTFTKLNIIFRVSRGGMLYTDVNLVTLMLDTKFQGAIAVLAGPMWIVCLVGFSCTLPNRATEKKSEGWGTCITHFLRFWNLLEWVIILGGWVIVMMFIVERTQNNVCKRSLDEYRIERQNVPPEEWGQLDRDYFTDLNHKATNASLTSMWMQVVVANYHLILVFRFFMASRGQPRLAVVLSTIRKASTDLIHLFIVFLIIVGAYVFSGHLLFGRRMPAYATLSSSFADCIQIVTEREYNWDKFTNEDLYTATAWVWSFLILVVLVLVNIFLAMIFDTYGDVRAAVGDSVSFWQTTKRFVRHLKMSLRPASQEGRWVPNRELVSAIQNMQSNQITPWMLKDSFPTISNKQVNHIFILAKNRHGQLLARSQRQNLPEVISRTLLSIEKLHIGLVLMKEQHMPDFVRASTMSPPDSAVSEKGIAVIDEDKPITFADAAKKKPISKSDQLNWSRASESSVLSSGSAYRVGTSAPSEAPGWIQVQLQPHFKKQAQTLAQIVAQIKGIERDLHVHAIGSDYPPCPPIPEIRPVPNFPEAPLVVHGRVWGRMNSPPPPADHVPAAVRFGLTREGLAEEDFPPREASQLLPSASRKLATEPRLPLAASALVDLRQQGRGSGGSLAAYCACSSL